MNCHRSTLEALLLVLGGWYALSFIVLGCFAVLSWFNSSRRRDNK